MGTTDNAHCGDRSPHGPHTWSSPARKGSGQDIHHCPGTPKK